MRNIKWNSRRLWLVSGLTATAVILAAWGGVASLGNHRIARISAGTAAGPSARPSPTASGTALPAATAPAKSQPASAAPRTPAPAAAGGFPLHSRITATYFYGGEAASSDNNWQTNTETAWCSDWQACFGGTDSPSSRTHDGSWPAGFQPKENPFYAALPCSDFNSGGLRSDFVNFASSSPVLKQLTGGAAPSEDSSLLKNRWIQISSGGRTAYAQWEDTGPFADPSGNDCPYVFGGPASRPSYSLGDHAGIDVSPAVKYRLGMGDTAQVSWQFVLPGQVPAGPWKDIITTSGPYWP